MPGKLLQPVAGGIGVASSGPFTAGQYTVITVSAPPAIAAGRLGQLADAVLSIVAPDVTGVASSFVLGRLANSRGQQKVVVVGDTIAISGAAAPTNMNTVAIGGNWDAGAAAPNQQNNVFIGWDFVLTTPDGSNVAIGNNVSLLTQGGFNPGGAVAIGAATIVRGGAPVVIGQNATGSFQDVVIGANALVAGGVSQAVCIGDGSRVSASLGVALGEAAVADSRSVAIGKSARSRGTRSITIGAQADDGVFNNVIVIGDNFTASQGDTCWIGTASSPIKTFVVEGGANFAVFEGVIRLLQAAAAPGSNPASGFYIYTDPADGLLKVRSSAGNFTTLAAP